MKYKQPSSGFELYSLYSSPQTIANHIKRDWQKYSVENKIILKHSLELKLHLSAGIAEEVDTDPWKFKRLSKKLINTRVTESGGVDNYGIG